MGLGLLSFSGRSCPSFTGTLVPTAPAPVLCCTQSRHRNPSGKTSHRLPARYYGPRPTFSLLREATCELKYSSSAFRQFCSFSAFFSFRSPIPSTPSARQAITTFTDETRSPLPTRNNPLHHHHHDLIDTSNFFSNATTTCKQCFFFSRVADSSKLHCTVFAREATCLRNANHTNPWCRALLSHSPLFTFGRAFRIQHPNKLHEPQICPTCLPTYLDTYLLLPKLVQRRRLRLAFHVATRHLNRVLHPLDPPSA